MWGLSLTSGQHCGVGYDYGHRLLVLVDIMIVLDRDIMIMMNILTLAQVEITIMKPISFLLAALNMNQELNFVRAFLTERRATSEAGCSEKWARVARSLSRSDAPHRHPDVMSNEHWVLTLL